MVYSWGHSRRFNSFPEFFKRKFGARVQKVSVHAGFTCPNRDGIKGTGGCTFCSNDAFNPSYCQTGKGIKEQLLEGIEFHKFRYRRVNQYLAYFQTYSNTYAPLARLKTIYEEALSVEGIIGLVIATRPDCLDDNILEYLQELSKRTYVALELGIESVRDDTLQKVNRMHSFSDACDAAKNIRQAGIHLGTHFIIGLPGENQITILEDIPHIAALQPDSVKFHQLQIFKGTPMELEYKKNPSSFYFPSLDEYIELMVKIAEHLPPNTVIERIASEVPPRHQVNPGWGQVRYDEVQRMFEKKLEDVDSWQGKLYFNL